MIQLNKHVDMEENYIGGHEQKGHLGSTNNQD